MIFNCSNNQYYWKFSSISPCYINNKYQFTIIVNFSESHLKNTNIFQILIILKLLTLKTSNNIDYKNISKKDLYNKLSKLSLKDIERLGLNHNEINYLKNKILNDRLGLVLNFEEKDEYLDNHYFGLEEIKELHINPKEKNNHLLIEGDNYYALKALQVSGIKVDVIYIDPPYNTGNKDFVYNDDFVEKDDQFKHSKWLSFMKKRLILARELLADDGVIFVSIDDNEQAYLKVLMDEIFGEENFISNLIWQNSTGGGLRKKHVNKTHESILFYTKNSNILPMLWAPLSQEAKQTYTYEENGKKYRLQQFAWRNKSNSENQKYPIITPDGTKIIPKESYIYRFIESSFNDLLAKNQIIFKQTEKSVFQTIDKKPTNWSISVKDYLGDGMTAPTSILNKEIVKGNIASVNEIKDLFGGVVFEYSKPKELIIFLISLKIKQNATILDFFAGSGTTAQAVMELNEEDGGNRRFILCTNNENNIAQDICRERIYRVINGEGSKKEKIDWEYSKDKKSLDSNSMKYLKTKPIHNVNGEYEEINEMKQIYKDEFNKELTIKDFK